MARPPKTAVAIRPLSGSRRELTLHAAGLTPRRLAALLDQAAKTIAEGMEAMVEVYSRSGELVAKVPDWRSRLKATQQILDLAGVIPSRNAPEAPTEKPKEEPVPEWARPLLARDVTPHKD